MATTVPPMAVTLVSTALAARAGRGSTASRQAEPPGEVHTAGEPPAAPAATRPDRAAVTPSIRPPPPAPATGARAQVLRSAENQAAGTGRPPARALPATTYPAGPAAAAARLVPGAVSGPAPDAGVQDVPLAEVRITGWYDARVPARPTVSHRAGAPPAAPAATCARPAVARALTVMSGVAAEVSTGCPTCCRPPAPTSSRRGRMPAAPEPGWPFPAATALPSGATVSPAIPRPGSAAWCQPWPRILTNATWPERVTADTAKPWLLPATAVTRIGVRRSGTSLPA